MFFTLYLYIFILGTVIGSFLNVIICRLPYGQSIIRPRSHCPQCANNLAWKHLIPLVSFLLQKGKCAHCKAKISIIYPLVEVVTGIVFVIIYTTIGFGWLTLVYWILAACFIAIIVIDWQHMIIPDEINFVIGSVGIIASVTGVTIPVAEAIIGCLTGGGILLLLAIISRGGMGGGDIKFLAALGLFTGWKLMLLLIFLASTIAAIYGIVRIMRVGYEQGRSIAFGPFLATAAMISLLYGNQLIDFYISLFYFQ